ncbi:MAG: YezD family protein [Candidatus Omnitrophica bacterium]|nr:YezD family protein [Candidatus Omnitrophota bacterium]
MAQETPQDQEILKAIRNIKFGSVEVVIHDSKVVQIEKKEKIRFQGTVTKV